MGNDYKMKSNYHPCLIPGCKRDLYGGGRGLCKNHLAAALTSVRRRRTTWEELEKNGRAKPKLTVQELRERRKLNADYKRVWSKDENCFVFEKRDQTTPNVVLTDLDF